MGKNEKFFIISERYKQRIQNLYKNAISDQDTRFPTIPVDLVKINFPKDIPEKKREKINVKIIKDLKKQKKLRPNATLLNIKSITTYDNDEELMKDLLREMPSTDENIEEVYHGVKIKMPSLIDTYFERFKSSFNELFSLFENYNNDVFNLFNLKIKTQGRSAHSLENISKEYGKLKINMEKFQHWVDLNELHLIRNALVHKDGLIDEIFIEKSTIRTNEDVGKTIQVNAELLFSLTLMILRFINFVFIEHNNLKNLKK
ncbi:hypothetical protein LCGC14_1056670 [marine sediment metagenome]|uniref:Uncharacterized protein n=1 Tax=marine sediment metagenome TaxID=412755 RepID=A0A0F9QTB4_9ZZZZ